MSEFFEDGFFSDPAPAEVGDPDYSRSTSYPGGKNGPGVYQSLINQIPPHDIYCAPFAGFDAIARHKLAARRTVLIDADRETINLWRSYLLDPSKADPDTIHQGNCRLFNSDAIEFLRRMNEVHADAHRNGSRPDRWFLFVDPPYLKSTRTSGRLYKHEFWHESDHLKLLNVLKQLKMPIMITGYPSDLYSEALSGWWTHNYHTVCRSGEQRLECAWMNYERPQRLHDSRFVGADKQQRQNLKRRFGRLQANLDALSDRDRQFMLDRLNETYFKQENF